MVEVVVDCGSECSGDVSMDMALRLVCGDKQLTSSMYVDPQYLQLAMTDTIKNKNVISLVNYVPTKF